MKCSIEALEQEWQTMSAGAGGASGDCEMLLLSCSHNWQRDPCAPAAAAREIEANRTSSSGREVILKMLHSETFKKLRELKWQELRSSVEELRAIRQLVLEAVEESWEALGCVAHELRGGRRIRLEPVKQNWESIRTMADSLYVDRQPALESAKQDWQALLFAAEELDVGNETLQELVRENGLVFIVAVEELCADSRLMLEAVQRIGLAIEYASDFLDADRKVVFEAVKENWSLLSSDPELKSLAHSLETRLGL